MAEKMAVVCNGDTPANIMPTLIFASSGLALDYEVHIFICPAGARWMLKGELEKLEMPGRMVLFHEDQVEAFAERLSGLSPDQAADLLGVPRNTVGKWIWEGKLPSRKVRGRRRLDFWRVVSFGVRRGLITDPVVREKCAELGIEYDPSYRAEADEADGGGFEEPGGGGGAGV